MVLNSFITMVLNSFTCLTSYILQMVMVSYSVMNEADTVALLQDDTYAGFCSLHSVYLT